ncbi:MAG TPA: heparinase, partial [Noviherbaspirillum sp.]
MSSDPSKSDKTAPSSNRTSGTPHPGRRSLLIQMSALLGVSLVPGLVIHGGNAFAQQPPAADPEAAETDAQITVTFQPASQAKNLDSRFAGLSYEKDKLTEPLFTPTNLALLQLLRLLGPGVLRIGANAVDRSSWNGAVKGLTPILPEHIDALATFVQAAQWQVIYGVNMARNTPENAASEAAYVASRLGPSLLAWEIGNEPDLYRRHRYRPRDWTYEDYIREWRALRDAMSAATPGIPFSGPSTAYNVPVFTLPFARDEGSRVPLLTHHYYRADRDDPDSTLDLLLRPDPNLMPELDTLVAAAAEAGMTQGVRIDEANSFYGGGLQNVSNAFGTALWVMDFLFNCAVAGCTGVNLHSGGSGPGYTPISEREGVVIEARPGFYGMFMFTLAAQGMPMTSMMDPPVDINLSAWGVQRSDGGFNAILINKDKSRSVAMNLVTNAPATSYDPIWLRGTSLTASAGQ